MLSLSRFSDFQEDGLIANCELNGTIKYSIPSEADSIISKFIPFISELPNVYFHETLSIDTLSAKYTAASPKELFLTIEDTKWSKIKTAWFENGVLSALATALESSFNCKMNPLERSLQKIYTFITKYYNKVNVEGKEDVVLPDYSLSKNWKSGVFRCIKWHPHCNKFAVITAKDDVRIYSAGIKSILKHRTQQHIMCVAWRPLSASDIAIACSEGVYIWSIEPNSIVSRPSITCAKLLSKPGHKYVCSVSWNKQGNLLVSSSICDRSMYIWDVSMEEAIPLQKYGGGIPTLSLWSPTSEYIFSATSNILFRIWSSVKWTSENWFTRSSRVRCACWAPDGSVLLFATVDEPFIYAITISSNFSIFSGTDGSDVARDSSAICVADFGRQELSSGEMIGGSILAMSWDPSGRLLAVIFKDSNLVPVFSTVVCTRPKILQLTPRCLIRGWINEIPNSIDFQQNVKCGSNLTIAWSSGRIQYFPFYGTDAHLIEL